MKNILFVLIVLFQQVFLFAQYDKSPGFNNAHFRNFSPLVNSMSSKEGTNSIFNRSMVTDATIYLPDTILVYSFEDTLRSVFTYDSHGNMLTEISELCVSGNWENYYTITFEYDESNNLINIIYHEWSDGDWEEYLERYLYEFDSFGNILTKVYQGYFDDEWYTYYRYSYTYDSDGNILTELLEDFSEDEWVFDERTTYTYDSDGILITKLEQYYVDDAWTGGTQTTYIYDDNGILLIAFSEWWNSETETWINSYRTIYYYDAGNYLINHITETWYEDNWKNSYSVNYTNDLNGNVIIWEFFQWESGTSSWVQTETEPYKLYINGKEFWTNSGYKIQLHWLSCEAPTLANSIESEGIILFPNPANAFINVSGLGQSNIVEIYSFDGKRIRTDIISDINQAIQVSQLKSGIYLLKIKTHNGIVLKKFIIQ